MLLMEEKSSSYATTKNEAYLKKPFKTPGMRLFGVVLTELREHSNYLDEYTHNEQTFLFLSVLRFLIHTEELYCIICSL